LSATDALPSPVAIGQPVTKLGGTVLNPDYALGKIINFIGNNF
jgi:hypothetical protein